MGSKYTTVSVSGYNATPPSDDGTVSEANKVKWSTIKTKLPDPLKTAIEAIDSRLQDHFNVGPTAITSNTTIGATHYNQIIQVSGASVTLTLTDAATLGAGWFCRIVNTDSSNNVTIGRATGGDTINGSASNFTLTSLHAIDVFVNAAANGFFLRSSVINPVTTDTAQTITATKTMSGAAFEFAEGADVASATTTNIWAGDGNTVHVTGTTTITSFGTAPQAGAFRFVIFDGALLLTHGSNLNLPGGTNYTTASGDIAFVYADTTTQFDVLIFPKSGTPAVAPTAAQGSSRVLIASATANNDSAIAFTSAISSTYDIYIVELMNIVPATNDVNLFMRMSTDNGSSYYFTSGDYSHAIIGYSNASISTASTSDTGIGINAAGVLGIVNTTSAGGLNATITLKKLSSTSERKHVVWDAGYVGTGTLLARVAGAGTGAATNIINNAVNAIRFHFSSGNITSGKFYLYGIKTS